MKIAAIEAMWNTETPPASFTVFGLPDREQKVTHAKVSVPWMLGLIATRSFDKPVEGISDLVNENKTHIVNGIAVYKALAALRANRDDADARAAVSNGWRDLGFALLLKRYRADIENASADEIDKAAWSTVPDVATLFWAFRFMVGLGFFFIALFAYAFYLSAKRKLHTKRWFMNVMLWSLPLPWIAAELGWIVAEYGRQPWAIDGVLPTFVAVSNVPASNVLFSLVGFVVFYTALAIVDVYLMLKYVRLGPEGYLTPSPGRAMPEE
jgi:cytochrome d ubiquinol oxidase subunit I